MQKEYKLSPARLKELTEELVYMKTVREKEISDQIKEARSFGDLSENSEYDEAKNEQGKLYSRIAEVENILAHAVVIDDSEIPTDRVSVGSRVVVTDLDAGETEEYQIVGSQEADPMNGRISEESPFGKGLVGGRIGQEVSIEVPAGIIKYRIDNIQK
ncbi:transcription elongation factor GreA [Papillibacter cinnamivorans]|uniref:Transcription elongation factor GreA n=1 Tax=Papillibacter cinnamivorans DSM 12816 TaxID=1122930 RepID=A0A1W1ZEM0_9FIRM|nr:transcription elongation factor GreA [Papillibacter cinnamivorans]SMC46837.1 transcription elongation factor GreA [Papillibacter cinnamivorans DSM 12816]